jgi:hypothetical protein
VPRLNDKEKDEVEEECWDVFDKTVTMTAREKKGTRDWVDATMERKRRCFCMTHCACVHVHRFV